MATIGPPVPPVLEERQYLEQLVQTIVVSQGNRFIRELLKSKEIRVGRTKTEFEANMLEAIEEGRLTRTHIEEWLREVEGWGNQHVYLYSVPNPVSRDLRWRDDRSVERLVARAGFGELWNAPSALEFPPARTLVGIYWSERRLQIIWQRGLESWVRQEDKDYQEEEDGELYRYKAFRQKFRSNYDTIRVPTRFETRRNLPQDAL